VSSSPAKPTAYSAGSSVLQGSPTLPLTDEELSSTRDQLRAVLEPYVERLGDTSKWPPAARLVRILLSGTPLELNPKEENE
jgi:hypothetical protein